MATVHGPSVAHHPTGFDKMTTKMVRSSSSAQKQASAPSDAYYGHEAVAKLCARFVSFLFACPDYPSTAPTSSPPPTLAVFVAYALHRTRLHPSVTFAALYLLGRLKQRFPAARGSSGHRLFLSAFMISSKVICDDTYSNKSWCIVGQGMFALREVNQMEREMCSYLEWELNVDPSCLRDFESILKREFGGPGPYRAIQLPMPAKSAPLSTASTSVPVDFLPAQKPRPAPSDPISASPPKPVIPPSYRRPSSTSPPSPTTPEMSDSPTPSPASSCSPQTPVSDFDPHPHIVGGLIRSTPAHVDRHQPIPAALKAAQMAKAIPGTGPGKLSTGPPRSVPSKTNPRASKTDAFAFAEASAW